jgi:endonuclease/exonuclease/phosphatase (EEP) superfamily protein YafD
MLVNFAWTVLTLGVLAVGLATVAGFFGGSGWLFDLASHFRVQYGLILLACIILYLIGGKMELAAVSATFAVLNLGLILPFYLPSATSRSRPAARTTRLVASNLLQKNNSYERVRSLISTEQPDILLLVEANQKWLDELDPVLGDYPFHLHALREDNYGIALYSRLTLIDAEIRSFGTAGLPSVVVRLSLDGHTLTIIGTHPPPPRSALGTDRRDAQLLDIARFVRVLPDPAMVVGDLNATVWSVGVRKLLKVGGLRDSRLGFGLQPSWPTHNRLMMIPIDHALVSPQVRVWQRRTGEEIGSDHLPFILDFNLDGYREEAI